MIHDRLNAFQFSVRNHLTGRLELRPGLPEPLESAGERSFYRMALEAALPEGGDFADQILDIGCRNWSYAGSLAEFFPHARISGIELDPGRRYWNLYRRGDAAEAFARKIRGGGREARFIPGNFLKWDSRRLGLASAESLCVTFFYPFVSERPCLKWGLPECYGHFDQLIAHAAGLVRGTGDRSAIVSCHQGEWEAEIAAQSYARAGLSFDLNVIAASAFAGSWPSLHDAHVFCAGP